MTIVVVEGGKTQMHYKPKRFAPADSASKRKANQAICADNNIGE